MIWVYDNAIVKDLQEDLGDNVSVLDPDQSIQVAALLQEDKIHFPIVSLTRANNFQISGERMNFTLAHRGITTVFDDERHDIYSEKVIPIDLSYEMTVMSTNQTDCDELIRELIFKYLEMYFVTVELPYEARRQIRIGLSIHPDDAIEWRNTPSNYLENGTLISGTMNLYVDGAVLVSYTASHLRRVGYEIETQLPKNTYNKSVSKKE